MDYPRLLSQNKQTRLFNNKIIEIHTIYEPDDLTLKPLVGGSNYPTRPLSKLVDMILKSFLIHM